MVRFLSVLVELAVIQHLSFDTRLATGSRIETFAVRPLGHGACRGSLHEGAREGLDSAVARFSRYLSGTETVPDEETGEAHRELRSVE